ncbi:MAG TPA: acetate/propionate family kinase [Phycisphaerae bacterium]|nr:acetate/propionate family kinase [Phycisphaerae bacterium]
MDHAAIADFLKKNVGLFKHFPDHRVAELVAGSQVASYEPNEAIVEFGEDATHLGAILEGEASASVIAESGDRQVLRRLKTGDTFGEMALMTGEKTMIDIIAETRCSVLLVPVSLFSSVIMTESRAVQHISRTMSERFRTVMLDPSQAAALRNQKKPITIQLKGERPEKILVLNCGSSSLKYCLFDTQNESNNVRGLVDRIGTDITRHTCRGPRGEVARNLPKGTHREAFEAMFAELTAKETGAVSSAAEISAVGHRVVHGGERFAETTVITDDVLRELETLCPLAPLHNPINLLGIREALRVFPSVPHFAVFDTAFHNTLPSFAYLYGLPYEYYEKKKVRRYGFHGTSHAYVCLAAAQYLCRRVNELEIISCHLGNGASVCAVDHGRSVDTSMGLTPAEGLIMGTRGGDIDPGVLVHLQREEGLTADQIDEILNRKSGLLGLSGISSDMREVERAAHEGNPRALVALKTFCYRLRKYIGAYVAAMGGLDVIIFTAGIGQGSARVRALALQGLRCMGVVLDEQRNREAHACEEIRRISADDSPVTVLVVPTDEERMIARECLRALSRSYIKQVLETQRQEPIPIEVSAHHVHLTQEHVEALFGVGHELTRQSDLSQPGQYACQEQVTLIGPRGRVERVRVLGPVRQFTQVEIAMTEQFKLGIHPPIRESGDLKDTPGITIEGPAGSVTIDKGVICAMRHIHMTPEDALRYGVRDKFTVRVCVPGDRELVFGDVRVRVDPSFRLAMHIDTDEGNAANISTGMTGYIDGIQNQG